MSRVSISKSYAVLLGLEGYMKTKKHAEAGMSEIEAKMERVLHPEQAARREEAMRDKSESAKREREYLEKQAKLDEEKRRQSSLRSRMAAKLGIGHSKHGAIDHQTSL